MAMPRRRLEDLIQRAKEGDTSAFEAVIDSHRDRLKSLIAGKLGPALRTLTDVEDVYQETLLRAFRALPGFSNRGKGSLLAWLGEIATRRILELARAREREREVPTGDADDFPGDSPSASAEMRRGERFDRLQAALNALPAEYRQVLVLARIQGLKVKDIAARTGRTPNGVSQMILRGLERLRALFGETESFSLPQRSLEDPAGQDLPPQMPPASPGDAGRRSRPKYRPPQVGQ